MNPDKEEPLHEQFASEYAKRARHMSEAAEQEAALTLMKNLSQFEWYQKQFTPAARMAHERELLEWNAAYEKSRVAKEMEK